MQEKEPVLTEEMFLEWTVELEEPPVLSRRNEEYFESYARHLTMSDVESLCEILLHPAEEIFTEKHLRVITVYGSLELGGEEHWIGSWRVRDILLGIREGEWEKNEVLHDTSQLLSKHKPDELNLKVRAWNHLINEGFMRIRK